jgi:hypothetical protein
MSNNPQDFDDTIERCEHDEENPYTQVLNALIRNKEISPNCRMIIIFLLSNKNNWVIRIPQLINEFKDHIGKDLMYKIINEAIEAGYIKREEYTKNNLKRYKYKLSEKPKFKKCFRHPDSQDTGAQYTENTDSKERTSTIKNIEKKQQHAALAAAVFSESSKKEKPTPKIYDCLIAIDIPMKDKYEISTRYDEETVKNAVAWATHKDNPPTKCLAASIKHACKHKLSIKEHEVKSRTPYERARDLFKNGSFYNNAECFLNANGISFSRGMLHDQVNFDKFFNWNRVKDLCKKFQILIPELK